MVNELMQLFERDLDRLTKEIKAYNQEADLWILPEGINNTGGNLCLHLVGNLQHFIGQVLGNSGFIRNREAEFGDKNIATATLLKEIETTKEAVSKALTSLTPEQLAANFPIEVFGKPMTTSFFLMHLSGHLNYHLGQINYHRRILS